jgi:hypothetical protein
MVSSTISSNSHGSNLPALIRKEFKESIRAASLSNRVLSPIWIRVSKYENPTAIPYQPLNHITTSIIEEKVVQSNADKFVG